MNITLFGGSFNPPHLGHALIIREFLASGLTDQVWLLPNNIHNFGKHLAPAHHRLEMCRLLLYLLTKNQKLRTDNLQLCPIEIDLNLSGKTIDTINCLHENSKYLFDQKLITNKQQPKTDFSFLMGSDQLPNFHKWDDYQTLLKQMTFWVYPRAGYQMEPLLSGMKPFLHDNQTITNLSSTLVRNRLHHDQDTSLILPPTISNYIRTHNLYIND